MSGKHIEFPGRKYIGRSGHSYIYFNAKSAKSTSKSTKWEIANIILKLRNQLCLYIVLADTSLSMVVVAKN